MADNKKDKKGQKVDPKPDKRQPKKPIAVKVFEFKNGNRKKAIPKAQREQFEREEAIKLDLSKFPAGDRTDNERIVWERLVPELKKIGIITKVDVEAFKRYCHHLKVYTDLKEKVDSTPPVITIYHGLTPAEVRDKAKPRIRAVKPNPIYAEYKAMSDLLLRYERNFGMTPAARACLDIEAEKERDAFQDFIDRRKDR